MDGDLRHAPPQAATLPRGAYRPFGAFRLALALLVVLQHLQYLLPDPLRTPFHRMGFGALAVGVFFALSGFIVAEALDSFYAARPGPFLLNRLLRVVPPYLAALAISAATQAVLWRTGQLALWDFTLHRDPLDPALLAAGVLSLLPGFHTSYVAQDFEYIPFVWTLRVEMAFYLAATAIAAGSDPRLRAPASPPRPPPRPSPPSPSTSSAGGPGLLTDVPFFLLGACLYATLRRPTPARVVATTLAAACTLAAFPHWDQRGLPTLALQLPALAALLAAMAALAAWPRVAPRWRRLDRTPRRALLPALPQPLRRRHRPLRHDPAAQRRALRHRPRRLPRPRLAHAPPGRDPPRPPPHPRPRQRGVITDLSSNQGQGLCPCTPPGAKPPLDPALLKDWFPKASLRRSVRARQNARQPQPRQSPGRRGTGPTTRQPPRARGRHPPSQDT